MFTKCLEIPDLVDYLNEILEALYQDWSEARPAQQVGGQDIEKNERRKGGRPGLSRDVLIYRIAKALEAEEIKLRNPDMVWKEIAKEIKWRHGYNGAGVKLLEDARKRLKRLESSDPEGLLPEVAAFREKEKKEKN